MIFVTVGTHEQPFNRLVKAVDELKKEGSINEDVFIQTGYSDYEPKYCKWAKFVSYKEMANYIKKADIIITHGGPASFLGVLEQKKSPIVVPRKEEFHEHVNNHQLDFAKKVQQYGYPITVVEDITTLGRLLDNYEKQSVVFNSHNANFNQKFCAIVENLIGENDI